MCQADTGATAAGADAAGAAGRALQARGRGSHLLGRGVLDPVPRILAPKIFLRIFKLKNIFADSSENGTF